MMSSNIPENVLVTGAAGFIGQVVVAELVKQGHHVKAMHRRPEQKELFTAEKNLETVVADVNDAVSMEKALQNIDVVIHLAGVVWGDASQMRSSMVDGTINLIEVMRKLKVKRLILASSIAVYDWGKLNGVLNEESPLLDKSDEGQSPYALAKIQQECVARDLCLSSGVGLTIFRLGAVFTSDRIETADLGPSVAGVQVVIAPLRKLRLVALQDVALSFVEACSNRVSNNLTINLVDEVQPSAWDFAKKVQGRKSSVKVVIPLPYVMLKAAAYPIYWMLKMLGIESKLPTLFLPKQIIGRFTSCRCDSSVWQKILPLIDRV